MMMTTRIMTIIALYNCFHWFIRSFVH